MSKANGDAVLGCLFVAAGVLFLIPAIGYGLLPPPNLFGLGAGFFPTVTSSFVIFFGLWIIFNALRKGSVIYFEGQDDLRRKFKIMITMLLIFILFLVIWILVETYVATSYGFFVGIAMMILVYNHLFGRSLKFNFIFTLIFVGLLWGIFYHILDIQFTL